MSHVYISYSRQDSEFALRLYQALEARGISGWLDVEAVPAGSDWTRMVGDAIGRADAVVVILSPRAVESEWIQHEYEYALRHYKPVFPVMVQDTRLPPDLAMLQYIDAREDWDRAVEQLIHVLNALAPTVSPQPSPAARSAASPAPAASSGSAYGPPPFAPTMTQEAAPVRERTLTRGRALRRRDWLLAGVAAIALIAGVWALAGVLSGEDKDHTGVMASPPASATPPEISAPLPSDATASQTPAPTRTLASAGTGTPTRPPGLARTGAPTGVPTGALTEAGILLESPTATSTTNFATQVGIIPFDTPVAVAGLGESAETDGDGLAAIELEIEARVATEVYVALAGTSAAMWATGEGSLSVAEAGAVAAMITRATAGQGGSDNRLLWAFNLGLLALLALGGAALAWNRTHQRPFKAVAHSPAHPNKAPAPLPHDYQVFISSSDVDKAWVARFVRDLGDLGYLAWWYAKDAPGLPFGQEIVRAIFYTKIFVVVVSPDSMESKHVEEEIRLADRFDRPIITVIYRDTDERIYGLAKSSDIDFSNEREYKGAMEFLTQAFNQLLERHRQAVGPDEATLPGDTAQPSTQAAP